VIHNFDGENYDIFDWLAGMVERAVGPAHPLYERVLWKGADECRYEDPRKALDLYRRALACGEKIHGVKNPRLAWMLHAIASILEDDGQFDAAVAHAERGLSLIQDPSGIDDPFLIGNLQWIANLHQLRGAQDKAEVYYGRALAVAEASPKTAPSYLVAALQGLAAFYSMSGRPDEARPLFERALNVGTGRLKPDDAMLLRVLREYAACLAAAGEEQRAGELLSRASIPEDVDTEDCVPRLFVRYRKPESGSMTMLKV